MYLWIRHSMKLYLLFFRLQEKIDLNIGSIKERKSSSCITFLNVTPNKTFSNIVLEIISFLEFFGHFNIVNMNIKSDRLSKKDIRFIEKTLYKLEIPYTIGNNIITIKKWW